jgi:hypothetical protein
VILLDTGPIVAGAITTDQHHRSCTELFTRAHHDQQRLLLPSTVAAEVGYLLDHYGGPAEEARFLRAVAGGDFELVELTVEDYARMAEFVDQYADARLGTTDASVIALAERLRITEEATTDRRHFPIVRPRHTAAFTLLPEQL